MKIIKNYHSLKIVLVLLFPVSQTESMFSFNRVGGWGGGKHNNYNYRILYIEVPHPLPPQVKFLDETLIMHLNNYEACSSYMHAVIQSFITAWPDITHSKNSQL